MSDLKKLIKTNLSNLFEDKHFKDMEVAFTGKELSDKESEQFDDMEEVGIEKNGKTMPNSKHNGEVTSEKQAKVSGKDATKYYKDTAKKMKKFQTPDVNQESQSRIGEALEVSPKVDREMSDAEAYETEVYGGGMQGLKYDDEGSDKEKALEDRMDDVHKNDPTYKKLKDAGKKYKDHKYNKPDEYHNSPKVRVENKEKMKYIGVNEDNIFKANGKLMSEEQVLKIANKVPSRVKVDESVFAITDGENYYKLLWEGDNQDGEAIITNFKNTTQIKESLEEAKKVWNFDSSNRASTKKTITENGDDAFRRMFNQLRDSDGLTEK